MRDRLNRLEKPGYLSVDDWLRWRELRNRLAHECPDQPDLRFRGRNLDDVDRCCARDGRRACGVEAAVWAVAPAKQH